ncbi:MAG TPA: hypothetical protein VD860_11105 [Azospirillum sp.]|nr:hypothetical protein [Azospirillum sp.]
MTGTMHEVAGGVGTSGRRSGAGLVLAVLLLTGCPGTTVPPDTATLSSRTSGTVASIQAPRPKAKPPVRAETPQGGLSNTVPGGIGVAMAAPAKLDPDALMGLDQRQTKRLLGVPVAMEDQAPARVWSYANGACTLKVFFYMDLSSQDFRALSYDVKSSDHVPDVDQRCFAQLLAQAGDGSRE